MQDKLDPYRFFMRVEGKTQGAFHSESADPGSEGDILCYRFKLESLAHNDPLRDKGAAALSQRPLLVAKPWGKSTPQFLDAFWNSEVLKVSLRFVRPDAHGNTVAPFQEIELTGATVASHKLTGGDRMYDTNAAHIELERIGFRFEKMKIKNVPGQTAAQYEWRKR